MIAAHQSPGKWSESRGNGNLAQPEVLLLTDTLDLPVMLLLIRFSPHFNLVKRPRRAKTYIVSIPLLESRALFDQIPLFINTYVEKSCCA